MKRPILFQTEMVQAILDGRKSQTRRLVKIPDIVKSPERFVYVGDSTKIDIPRKAVPYDDRIYHEWTLINNNSCSWVDCCPYGKAGDVLWVRETHYAYGHWTSITDTKTGKVKWHFHDLTLSSCLKYHYENCPPKVVLKGRFGLGYFRRPSIFMPKEACRIMLEVTKTRVERLHDISENDSIAEGIVFKKSKTCLNIPARAHYMMLWDSINGKDFHEINPWLWVISFIRKS